MTRQTWIGLLALLLHGASFAQTQPPRPADAHGVPSTHALPSWNEGAAKRSITAFVERVTRRGGPEFVPVPERIAVFDNDGTLWSEKPVPFQMLFALDRVKAMAPQHPEWGTREPFASLLKGDKAGLSRRPERRGFCRSWPQPTPA